MEKTVKAFVWALVIGAACFGVYLIARYNAPNLRAEVPMASTPASEQSRQPG